MMPFREQVAWVALVGIALAFAAYFGVLGYAVMRGRVDHGDFIGWLILVVIAQVIITIVATAIIAIRAPADANAPQDERDRDISRRSAARVYPWLLAGVLLTAGSIHLGLGVFGMLNGILATVMLAEAVRFGMQIGDYRAGR